MKGSKGYASVVHKEGQKRKQKILMRKEQDQFHKVQPLVPHGNATPLVQNLRISSRRY